MQPENRDFPEEIEHFDDQREIGLRILSRIIARHHINSSKSASVENSWKSNVGGKQNDQSKPSPP